MRPPALYRDLRDSKRCPGRRLRGGTVNTMTRHSDRPGEKLTEDSWSRALYLASHSREFPQDLRGKDFSGQDLSGQDYSYADLYGANLRSARLYNTNLRFANLQGAKLSSADMPLCDLEGANLLRAELEGANLRSANLERAVLVGAMVAGALSGARVYGISAWDLRGDPLDQHELVITPRTASEVTVDNINIAQFVYLLLENRAIRDIIDTVTSRLVLILGRFTAERKDILDRLRDEIRANHLVPVVFDFEKPTSKDITGTVETLARMARFIVADLTDPRSIPHELATVVPFLRSTPVVPIKLSGAEAYSMFDDLLRYPWVLPVQEYETAAALMSSIRRVIISPAEDRLEDLRSSQRLHRETDDK